MFAVNLISMKTVPDQYKELFVWYGYCNMLVRDNGLCVTSPHFSNYLLNRKFIILIPQISSSSNGEVCVIT